MSADTPAVAVAVATLDGSLREHSIPDDAAPVAVAVAVGAPKPSSRQSSFTNKHLAPPEPTGPVALYGRTSVWLHSCSPEVHAAPLPSGTVSFVSDEGAHEWCEPTRNSGSTL